MTSLFTISIRAISASLLVSLVGCGVLNPVGEPKFDCNRKQDAKSVYCKSFKSVEASTNGDVPQSRFDVEFNLSDRDRLLGIAPDSDSTAHKPDESRAAPTPTTPQSAIALPHQVRSAPPLAGQPVREGPVIQRTWIKRFRDGNDLLVENLVVYKEIRGNRWSGFDQFSKAGTGPIYPRKPAAERSTETFVSPPKSAANAAESAPQFKQPGSNAGSSESAPFPAASGNLTMPQ